MSEIHVHSKREQVIRGNQNSITTKRKKQAINAYAIMCVLEEADSPLTMDEILKQLKKRNTSLSDAGVRQIMKLEKYWPDGKKVVVFTESGDRSRRRNFYYLAEKDATS